MAEATAEMLSIVKAVEEIKKSYENFATVEKVEAMGAKFEAFAALQRAAKVEATKNAIFGDQRSYDLVANLLADELVKAGKLEKSGVSEWLTKANANINSTDAGQGSTFKPTTIYSVISKLIETNGVLRANARVIPGIKGTLGIKKRATRITVGGQTRPDGAIAKGGSTYDSVPLTTYQVAAITTVEEKLIYESPINLVEEAISDIAEAVAEFEDDVLWNGDGTAADCGFTGLNAANTGVGGADLTPTASGLDLDDVLNLRTYVHTSVFGKGDYYMHPHVFAHFQTMKASTSGVYFFDIQSGSYKLGGSSIKFSPRMDSDVNNGSVPVFYGSLSKAVTVGTGRDYEVRVLNELYAADGQIGVRMVYDLGLTLVEGSAMAKIVVTGS